MEERHDYTRGGKRFTDVTGTTAEGLPFIYTDHLDYDVNLSKGQPVRESPEKITIHFTRDAQGRGVLSSIETEGGLALLGNTGLMLLRLGVQRQMQANKQDLLDFVAMFWSKAKGFIRNGRVRQMEGHNYMPVAMLDNTGNTVSIPESHYTAGGKVVAGVTYLLESEATNNYYTHRVDGTEIITAG